MDKISIIVPCYNEQDSLPYFYVAVTEISKKMADQEFEYLFINDGSKDDTLNLIKELSNKDKRVKYISFSRNFGKEAGMYAGLQYATGDFVVVMDADLQDSPNLLETMYKEIKTGKYDCIATRRTTRDGEPAIRSFFARQFYKMINKISKTNIMPGARDFRMMTRQMVNAILSVGECNRFSKGIFNWVGFETKWIEHVNAKRVAGTTKWSFWNLFVYSVEGITSFSSLPLALASVVGLAFCIIAFFLICVVIFRTLVFGDPVAGWPSLVCIISMLGGLQLLCIGVLGQYLAKTYLETKHRPIYIIKENNAEKLNN